MRSLGIQDTQMASLLYSSCARSTYTMREPSKPTPVSSNVAVVADNQAQEPLSII